MIKNDKLNTEGNTGKAVLGLRVDVDTTSGMKYGVPRLLELFDSMDVKASFFIPFGPDHTGYAIKRILNREFFSKMIRMNAWKNYGLRTLLSGIILPGREIGSGFDSILTKAFSDSHELGIHGWDHFAWQNRISKMSSEEIVHELNSAVKMFRQTTGMMPHASAAPGWATSGSSLIMQERYDFLFASDTRGWSPFFPSIEGKILKTLQIPVTLPTLDECYGKSCTTPEHFNELILSYFDESSVHVLTVHAELEGRRFLKPFENLLRTLIDSGVRIVPLGNIAAGTRPDMVPICSIEQRKLPGRAGRISFQGKELEISFQIREAKRSGNGEEIDTPALSSLSTQ